MVAEHRWALAIFARHVIRCSAPGLRRHFFVPTVPDVRS